MKRIAKILFLIAVSISLLGCDKFSDEDLYGRWETNWDWDFYSDGNRAIRYYMVFYEKGHGLWGKDFRMDGEIKPDYSPEYAMWWTRNGSSIIVKMIGYPSGVNYALSGSEAGPSQRLTGFCGTFAHVSW